jgi:hypothetical protein
VASFVDHHLIRVPEVATFESGMSNTPSPSNALCSMSEEPYVKALLFQLHRAIPLATFWALKPGLLKIVALVWLSKPLRHLVILNS